MSFLDESAPAHDWNCGFDVLFVARVGIPERRTGPGASSAITGNE